MKTINELFDFKGKVIIITGWSGAIGSQALIIIGVIAGIVLGVVNYLTLKNCVLPETIPAISQSQAV